MCCLIPMAWISFRYLNLTDEVTGGLIENLSTALGAISGSLGGGAEGIFIEVLLGMVIGIVLIFLFPIHWALFYRPDDIGLLIAVTVPWILCCVITSGLFAHSPRGGVHTSLAIGIGYAIILTTVYIILAVAIPFGIGSAILDGILIGLTDLPFLVAVLTAVLEGYLIGAIFGAFIGSLKYKPKGVKGKKKKEKSKEDSSELPELFPADNKQTESITTQTSDFCKNCGARFTIEDLFCTNCGAIKS